MTETSKPKPTALKTLADICTATGKHSDQSGTDVLGNVAASILYSVLAFRAARRGDTAKTVLFTGIGLGRAIEYQRRCLAHDLRVAAEERQSVNVFNMGKSAPRVPRPARTQADADAERRGGQFGEQA